VSCLCDFCGMSEEREGSFGTIERYGMGLDEMDDTAHAIEGGCFGIGNVLRGI